MSTILFTRPEHDTTTHYLSNWSKPVILFGEQKGIKILDLHREKAVRKEVENRLIKFSPALVVFNGHGNEQSVTGHKNEPLITANDNEHLLRGKMVYAISCKSAKTLGVKSVAAGAINYIGYNDDFIFLYAPDKVSRPLEDEIAGHFLEHSQVYIESLMKGNTSQEAFKRSKENLKIHFLRALEKQQNPAARFLWWDWKNFVAHGNTESRLE